MPHTDDPSLTKFRLIKEVDLLGSRLVRHTGNSDWNPIIRVRARYDNYYTCEVTGVTEEGEYMDISDMATLTPEPTSSDTSIVTVDPPVKMSFGIHIRGPLTEPGKPVIIEITKSWNDPKLGSHKFSMPINVIYNNVIFPDELTAA